MFPRWSLSDPILSSIECDLIKKTIEPDLEKGRIAGGVINRRVRNTLTCFIHSEDCQEHGKYTAIKKPIEKIVDSFLFIANDSYLTKLQYIEAINFSKYEIGGHYKWHLDSQKDIYTENKGNGRDISASFFLDDPKTYKGGELEFFDHGIVNPSQPQGCLCLFPSLLTHRVKKVTSGKRSTLVIWGHIFNPEE